MLLWPYFWKKPNLFIRLNGIVGLENENLLDSETIELGVEDGAGGFD